MNTIIAIFRRDVGKLLSRPTACIIMIGLIIIPSLYAWFNIAANWDPYSNTKNIAIGVANNDTGTVLSGASLNVGDKVVQELRANDAMDWTFVSEQEALEGVRSGRFYAAVVIPRDFSQNMASITTGTITKPQLHYYLNEKTNAIANKMTNVGVDTVQNKVNQAFVETVTLVAGQLLNISADKLNQADPIDSLIKDMDEANTSLGQLKITLAAVQNAGTAARQLVSATQTLLPDAQALGQDTQALGQDGQNLLSSGRAMGTQLDSAITSIAAMVQSQSRSLTATLRDLASQTGANADTVADQLNDSEAICNHIIDLCNKTITLLTGLEKDAPALKAAIDPILSQLNDVVSKEQAMADGLTAAAREFRQTGQVSRDKLNALADQNAAIDARLTTLVNSLQSSFSPALESTVSDLYDSLGDYETLLSHAQSSLSDVNNALGSVGGALDSGNVALNDLQAIIDRGQGKLNTITTQLGSVKTDARWGQLMNLMRVDPATGASFFSSPVGLQTTRYFPVDNYGAAMTPFYTTLCLWVGALVLVAILKTEVKHPEDFGGLLPWQAYFGRYALFFIAAVLQGLVACLGDLLILKVHMTNPVLFTLCGVWTSIVYSFFIYTLTVAFDEVGKAIAVLLMVIQVAGSGGTFPIQVLPGFFQALNPYMAFTFSIGAMRESVAGLYSNYYIVDMLKLLSYIGVSLLIGLVLRIPIIKLNGFFKRRLSDTGLM